MGLADVNHSGSEINRKVGRSLRAQLLAAMALSLGLLIISPVAAYSSLFGSLAALIPTLVFTALVLTKIGNDSSTFLRAAVVGEATKLLLTALICMAVFLWVKPLAAGWFFTGMIMVIIIGYLGLFFGD